MNNYELEFERINRKLDMLFTTINGLVNKLEREGYDKHRAELEDKAECAKKEVLWHIQNWHYLEEGQEWARKDWNSIDDSYYRMKGEIKDDSCYPCERVDSPEVL